MCRRPVLGEDDISLLKDDDLILNVVNKIKVLFLTDGPYVSLNFGGTIHEKSS